MKKKRTETEVPEYIFHKALKHFFGNHVKIEKAPQTVDINEGIDYFVYFPDKKYIGIDIKVRKNTNKRLTLEVEWLNKPKMAWLFGSKADYFLFTHEDVKSGGFECYLVKSTDARRLIREVPFRDRAGWIDPDLSVAVVYFYEYEDLTKIGVMPKKVFIKLETNQNP